MLSVVVLLYHIVVRSFALVSAHHFVGIVLEVAMTSIVAVSAS
jgi:hypothetical protein